MGQKIGNHDDGLPVHAPPMAGRNELGRHLLTLRTAKRMTQQEVADKAGVSNSDLSRWENGVRVPKRESAREGLIRVGQVLGERPVVLLEMAGFEPRETSNRWPPIKSLIDGHPDLTAPQKRALQTMIDSWP